MRVARIEEGLVADLWEVPALDCFGTDVVLVEVPEGILIGASYTPELGFLNQESTTDALPNLAVSPRQIRQALSRAGLRTAVEAAIAAGDQDGKDWWEFATQFERLHPTVVAMGQALGQTDAQMDALWQLAATL